MKVYLGQLPIINSNLYNFAWFVRYTVYSTAELNKYRIKKKKMNTKKYHTPKLTFPIYYVNLSKLYGLRSIRFIVGEIYVFDIIRKTL